MDSSFPEPWVERVMRRAAEDGEFDDLSGQGEPIPDLGRPYDPSWWARTWIERERHSEAANRLSARVRRRVPQVLAGTDPAAIRAQLDALNEEIAACNADLPAAQRLPSLDADRLLSERSRRLS